MRFRFDIDIREGLTDDQGGDQDDSLGAVAGR
jgi:hypothetical protein